MTAPRRAASLVVLAAVVVVAGIAAVLLGRGGQETAPPASRDPRGLLSLGATSQFDLGRGAPLRVALRAPQAAGARLRATVGTLGHSRAIALGPARRLAAGARTAELPVSTGTARAIDRCADRWLSVTLEDADGTQLARDVRRLPGDPPACGRFFGASSIWNAPLRDDAPLDPRSKLWAADLRRQAQDGYARNFPPTLNTTAYSTPIYTVPADQARVKVTLTGSRVAYGGKIKDELAAGVPIPPGARPSDGTDAHMVVWQPATDTMWETWVTRHADDGWTASWGGRMEHASTAPGYFSDPSGIQPGATATSLPLVGGLITLEDLRRGRIDHALGVAIPRSRSGVWARPAQRTDGTVGSVDAIPAGARFRLDPDLDVDDLDLPPLIAMMAHAAQRYGIYVRDTSPTVTFYGEDPRPSRSGEWQRALTQPSSVLLRTFPWDHLQVLKADLYTWSNKRVAR